MHDGPRPPDDLIAGLATALTRAGSGTAPTVSTVGGAVEASLADPRSAVALLEVRLLAGDAEPAERLAATARRVWRAGAPERVAGLVATARRRWHRAGDVAHRLAPDLKAGRGGLLDLALLDALVAARLADPPSAEVRAARRVLLDLRTDLHREAGRARDVLRVEDAHALVGADQRELVRAVSGAARTVVAATEAALRRCSPPPRPAGRTRPTGEGVVEHAGELTVARQARPARDPVLVLRLAAAAARTGLPMAPTALRRLADAAPELRGPWPAAARAELVALLGADGMIGVVEALDRAGLWGRLLPEWAAVRDLPPPDHHRHVWTVGRHLLEVTREAALLADRVPRKDLLLLGALVHDLGRGRGGDPLVVGAAVADRVGRRLGLPPGDVATLTAMVRQQRLLPRAARHDDPTDPATARRVVAALDGDPVLLELLRALAEADARGTGPGGWTPWFADLLDTLVARCRAVPRAREPLDR